MMRQFSVPAKMILLFLAFGAAIAGSQFLFSRARIDLTQDRLYTLNDATTQILEKLKEPIKFRFTYSAKAASGYPDIQAYAEQVGDLLDAFARASKGKIQVERITPEAYSEAEDLAVQAGLRGAPTASGDTLYFGLEASNSTTGRKVIPFFAPDREPQLEYDLVNMITQLAKPQKRKVALLTTLPMAFGPGGPIAMLQGNSRPYVIYQQMREQFQLVNLEPGFTDIPKDVTLLVIAHPRALTTPQLYAIDQFVMRGGRILLFIDPVSEVALTLQGSAAMMPNAVAPPVASDFQPLLSAWGVTLSPGQVTADGKFAQQVSVESGRPVFYLPWIGVQSSAFSSGNLALQGLRQINLATSGILELKPRDKLTQETLITTSDVAGVFDATLFQNNPDPAMLIETFKPTGLQYALAASLTGTFTSAFKTAPVDGQPFLQHSAIPTSIVVVADTDMLSDALWVNVTGDRDTPVFQPIADNGSFFFNVLDQLQGAPELLSLRSRRPSTRPFTLVQEKQIAAERDLRARQAALMEDLTTTQSRIAKLEGAGGTSEKFLSRAQKAEIEKFRARVTQTRKSLRETQGKLRLSVDSLKTRITIANVAAIPVLLLAFSLIRALRRNRMARA